MIPVLAHLLHYKGQSLKYSPAWGNLLFSFVVLYVREGSGRDQYCLLGSHAVSSLFSHFPYVTGSLLAAALVLNPRLGGFAYILGPCGYFKWTLLRDGQSLPPSQPPLVFTVRIYEVSFPWAGTLSCKVWPGAGILAPQVSLPVVICYT